jgi:hypothetical protein
MIKRSRIFRDLAVFCALAVVGAGVAVQAQEGTPKAKRGIEPQAEKLLRQMTEYLASLKSFKVRNASVDEMVTTAGQKIQLASESQVYVQRPNRLRSQQVGAATGMGFWYDGKTMTLTCPSSNSYATVPAPPTLDATIDAARKKFQIEAPGADLLYSRPYEILTEQVTGGRFVGRESINGVAVNHLAFTGEEVDWQIWIQEGQQPLPLRFVITTKTMKSQPEFTVQLSNWEPQASLDDSTFTFQAPTGSTRTQTFEAACAATR